MTSTSLISETFLPGHIDEVLLSDLELQELGCPVPGCWLIKLKVEYFFGQLLELLNSFVGGGRKPHRDGVRDGFPPCHQPN